MFPVNALSAWMRSGQQALLTSIHFRTDELETPDVWSPRMSLKTGTEEEATRRILQAAHGQEEVTCQENIDGGKRTGLKHN
jgi:hypothetical protein